MGKSKIVAVADAMVAVAKTAVSSTQATISAVEMAVSSSWKISVAKPLLSGLVGADKRRLALIGADPCFQR